LSPTTSFYWVSLVLPLCEIKSPAALELINFNEYFIGPFSHGEGNDFLIGFGYTASFFTEDNIAVEPKFKTIVAAQTNLYFGGFL